VPKEVVWLGDSKKVLADFSEQVRENLGWNLWQLQKGLMPTDSRPMPSISAGVYELKQADKAGWYRVIYYLRVKGKIIVLHSFTKKSRKTDQRDLEIADQRLRKFLSEVER